jgi:hypothetical protein
MPRLAATRPGSGHCAEAICGLQTIVDLDLYNLPGLFMTRPTGLFARSRVFNVPSSTPALSAVANNPGYRLKQSRRSGHEKSDKRVDLVD